MIAQNVKAETLFRGNLMVDSVNDGLRKPNRNTMFRVHQQSDKLGKIKNVEHYYQSYEKVERFTLRPVAGSKFE